MVYFDISDNELYRNNLELVINTITKRIHPIFEAYVDIGILLCLYITYFLSRYRLPVAYGVTCIKYN